MNFQNLGTFLKRRGKKKGKDEKKVRVLILKRGEKGLYIGWKESTTKE